MTLPTAGTYCAPGMETAPSGGRALAARNYEEGSPGLS
jgi:hypothetical protein